MKKTARCKSFSCGIVLSLFLCIPGFASSEVGPDGSFNFSIPIEVPPATAGIGPELSLSYNSESDNGIVGVGWNLTGFDVISRDPRYPISFIDPPNSNADHFIFMGHPLIQDTSDLSMYHTKSETYLRIKFCTSGGSGGPNGNGNYWKVTDKNGVVRLYGSRATSTTGTNRRGGGFITVFGKNNILSNYTTARVWALDKVIDVFENYYTIDYEQPYDDTGIRGGAYYPAQITYTRNDATGKTYNKYRVVTFQYSIGRLDTSIPALPGALYVDRLLSGITVYTNVTLNADGTIANGFVHHSYGLWYNIILENHISRSYLRTFQEQSGDGTLTKPPYTFSYTPGHQVVLEDSNVTGHSAIKADHQPVLATADFNGDGRDDLMVYKGNHFIDIYYSTPQDPASFGGFSKDPQRIFYADWKDKINDVQSDLSSVILFGDFNGDQQQDFMLYGGRSGASGVHQQWKVFLSDSTGFDPVINPGKVVDFGDTTDASTSAPVFDTNLFRVGDFNGDGKSDIVSLSPMLPPMRNKAPWRVFLANSDCSGFNSTAASVSYDPYAGNTDNGCSSYDPNNFVMGDFDGDGANDFIIYELTYAGNYWVIHLSKKDGTFTRLPVTYDFEANNNGPVHVYFRDFNGDGRTDVLAHTNGFTTGVFNPDLNNTEGTCTIYYAIPQNVSVPLPRYFRYPSQIPGNTIHIPKIYKFDPSWFGDFNGDGITDFIIGSLGTHIGTLEYSSFTFKTYLGTGIEGMPFVEASGRTTLENFALDPDVKDYPYNDITRALVSGDFDGNGTTDYMYRTTMVTDEHTGVVTHMDGSRSAQYKTITSIGNGLFMTMGNGGCPDIGAHYERWGTDRVRISALGDFSGSGKTQVIASQTEALDDPNFTGWAKYILYRQNDNRRANTLEKITNGMGGTTSISYMPAGAYVFQASLGSSTVALPIDPSLATPIGLPNKSVRNLVESIKIYTGEPIRAMNDSLSASNPSSFTRYNYCSGLYHPGYGIEKYSLGFRFIEALDLQTGCKTVTWYSQGLFTNGTISTIETYDSTGALRTRSDTTYEARQVSPSLPVYFICKTEEYYKVIETLIWTGGAVTYETKHSCIDHGGYDAYGNSIVIRNLGNPGTKFDDTETHIDFAVNTTSGLMKIYKQETYGWDNGNPPQWGLATQTLKYFDNLPLGSIDKGLVMKTVSKAGGNDPDVVCTFTYDNWGNCTSVTDGRSLTTQNFYDTNYHLLITKTIGPGPQNLTTEYTFDDYMNPWKTIDTSNNVTTSEIRYNSFHQPWKIIGPNDTFANPLTTIVYDYSQKEVDPGLGLLSPRCVHTITKPAQGTTAVETYTYYNGLGQKIREKENDSRFAGAWRATDYYYDSSARLWQVTEPYDISQGPDYPAQVWNIPATTITFDAIGRPSSVKYPDGTETTRYYGPNISGSTDRNGNFTSTDTSGNVKIAREYRGTFPLNQQPLGNGTITHEYRGGTTVIDNNNNTTKTVIDMLGRRKQITSPDMGTWTFTSDGDGNITSITDAKNKTTTYTYDEYNRVKSIIGPSGTTDTVYTYDEANHGYSKGRVTTASYKSGSVSYVYDNMGRISSQTVTIDGTSKTESFTYYQTGKLATKTQPDGEVLTYSYNFDGTLDKVTGVKQNTWQVDYISDMEYNIRNQIRTFTKGNSLTTSFEYYDNTSKKDPVSNIALSYRCSLESTPVKSGKGMSYTFGYDKMGNLCSRTDSLYSDGTASYSYDELGRIIASNSSLFGNKSYTYDMAGNILTKDGNTYQYYPGTNRVSFDGAYYYNYDENGNIVSKSIKQSSIASKARIGQVYYNSLQDAYANAQTNDTIQATASSFFGDISPASNSAGNVTFSGGWDSDFGTTVGSSIFCGQIKSKLQTLHFKKFILSPNGKTGAATLNFAYDYNNMLISAGPSTYDYFGESRVKKVENGITTRYFFGDYEEESGTGTTIVKYYPGGAQRRINSGIGTSALSYVYKDVSGNAAMVTDDAGNETDLMYYDPFGSKIIENGSTTVKQKFASGELDATGLHYFGARYYDANMGRFITPDTIVPGGSTQNLNRYSYCLNNPVNYTDPSGHEGQQTESMAPGLWALNLLDDAYKYSGLKKIMSITDTVTKTALRCATDLFNEAGIKKLNFGIGWGVAVETSINCETGDYSTNAGSGAGIEAGFTTRYGDFGGGCFTNAGLGYNSADQSYYFKAGTSASAGKRYGGSVTMGYSFKNHAGYQSVTVKMYYAQFGWSSYGGNYSVGYSLSYGGLSLSWSSTDGFSLGCTLLSRDGNSAGFSYNVNNGKWRGFVSIEMCFVAGTKIETVDGPKNIEDIKAGDTVKSYNEKTGEFGYKKVLGTIITHPDEIVKIKIGDDLLECTKEHPFFVVTGSQSGIQSASYPAKNDDSIGTWVEAANLKPGMMLLSSDGWFKKIANVGIVSRNETTYNFEVADWHTYCVGKNNVVVHNDGYKCKDLKSCIMEAAKDGTKAIGQGNSGVQYFDFGMKLGEAIVGLFDLITEPHYLDPRDLGIEPTIPPAPGRAVYENVPAPPDLYSGVEELPLIGIEEVPADVEDLDLVK